MTQTLAIFYDAYRSLNAKKMFWIVLILSVLVAGAFACVGINQRGLKVLVWQLGGPTTEDIEAAMFYKLIFVSFGIGVWLAWFATILALISTAGIFPDLINSGSITLLVSKPIGRLRLFFTQYAAGLLFVTLQVTAFSLACFLVIGLRGGVWEPGLFVAVPVVVCFFSYMFSMCALLGLVTRSTLAALLLTLLFWFVTFLVGYAENLLLLGRTQQKYGTSPFTAAPMRARHERIARRRPALGQLPPTPPAAASEGNHDSTLKRGSKVPRAVGRALLKAVAQPAAADEKEGTKPELAQAHIFKPLDNQTGADHQTDAGHQQQGSSKLKTAHDILYGVKTVLPKTSETIGLLERSLYDMADLPENLMGQSGNQAQVQRELVETIRSRSIWWVVGTSLGFEALVLCLAAFIFCRRDY